MAFSGEWCLTMWIAFCQHSHAHPCTCTHTNAHTHLILSHLFVSIVCVEKANVTGTESQITHIRKRHLLTQKSSKRSKRCSFNTQQKISRLHHEQYLWKIRHSQKQTRVKSNFAFLQHPKKATLTRFNWWLAFGSSLNRSFFRFRKRNKKNRDQIDFLLRQESVHLRSKWNLFEGFLVSWCRAIEPKSTLAPFYSVVVTSPVVGLVALSLGLIPTTLLLMESLLPIEEA